MDDKGLPSEHVDRGVVQPNRVDVDGITVTEWKVDIGDTLPDGFYDNRAGDTDVWAMDVRPKDDLMSEPTRVVFHKQPDGTWLRTS
jgi:hypothetical protein